MIELIKNIKPDNRSPLEQQQKVLFKLLKKAKWTEFGKHYQFSKIKSSSNPILAFQEAVPVFDYEKMYQEWWKRTINNEQNVSWPGDVKYFALTSGTSVGSSKFIPVTDDMIKAIKLVGTRIFLRFAKKEYRHLVKKRALMLGGSSSLNQGNGALVGDLSGINLSNTPFWFRPIYLPGRKISDIKDWDQRIDAIVKKAPEWDVGIISGIPSWVSLMIERIIDHYNLDTIHDIWPSLGAFVHGGIAFSPYKKSFEHLFAKPMIYVDTYLASEGFIAYQKAMDDEYMTLVLNNDIFLEFIPFDEDHFDSEGTLINSDDIVDYSRVEEGKDYAILLSNSAGAWRYQIGDVIRIMDKAKCQISIVGRTKLFLSVCGEHLSIDNMNMAVMAAEKKFGISIPEYTVMSVPKNNFFTHKWFVGHTGEVNTEVLRNFIDHKLMELNDDYRTERSSVLQDIEMEILAPDVFFEFLTKQGKKGGQNKFPRVLKGKIKDSWKEFISEKMNNIS